MPTNLKIIAVVIAVLLQLIPYIASAVTIKVPLNKPTIQAAIDTAQDGDVIQVHPGIYFENIDFHGKAISVIAERGARPAIIDGRFLESVVTFASGEGQTSVLSGFIIQNGRSGLYTAGRGDGGGIRISNSSPIIKFNTIRDNEACAGAGISIVFGSPIIQGNRIVNNAQSGCSGGPGGAGIGIRGAAKAQILDNVIANNIMDAGDGGGISLFAAGTPTIRGNIIRANNATGLFPCTNGGGISIVNYSDAAIVQNLITGNTAVCGGGIYWDVPLGKRGPFLVNNTIADNFGAGGVFAEGFDKDSLLINNIIVATAGRAALYCKAYNKNLPIITSNDIFSPDHVAYDGDCKDKTGMAGNISADPLFISTVNRNYHIKRRSPAVDAGDNSAPSLPYQDFDGARRSEDGNSDGVTKVDMGIDELTSAAKITDLSNGADLAVVDESLSADRAPLTADEPPASVPVHLRDMTFDAHVTVFVYDPSGRLVDQIDANGVRLNDYQKEHGPE